MSIKPKLNFNSEITHVVKTSILIQIILLLFIYTFHQLYPFSQLSSQINFFYQESNYRIGSLLSTWDGQWYYYLTDNGYGAGSDGDPGIAKFNFFPLYPLTIRIISTLLPIDTVIVGIIFNLLTTTITAIIMYRLFRLDSNQETSNLSVFFFLIAPSAIFYLAFYNQSLFMLLSITSFYLARKKCWWLSALLAIFTTATRPQGILLFIALLIEYYYQFRQSHLANFKQFFIQTKYGLIAILLAPLGLLLVGLNSYYYTNSLTTYNQSIRYFQANSLSLRNILDTFLVNLVNFTRMPLHNYRFSQLNVIYLLGFIFLLILMTKKLRPSYTVYAILIFIAPLLAGTTSATIRSLSIAFPAYLMLGYISQKHQLLKTGIIVTSLLLLSLLSLMYVNWHWVA